MLDHMTFRVTDIQRAKAFYIRGRKNYDLGRFHRAIALYERAYEEMPDAAFLFNIYIFRAPSGVRYDAATRKFAVPGSWVPLVLMMTIFLS